MSSFTTAVAVAVAVGGVLLPSLLRLRLRLLLLLLLSLWLSVDCWWRTLPRLAQNAILHDTPPTDYYTFLSDFARICLCCLPCHTLSTPSPSLIGASCTAPQGVAVFGHQCQGARAAAEPLQQDCASYRSTRRPTGKPQSPRECASSCRSRRFAV